MRPSQEDQVKAFRKAAREVGAEATDDQFKNVLRTIGRTKPSSVNGKESRPAKKRGK